MLSARGARASTIIVRRLARDAARRAPAITADGVRIRLDANIEFPGRSGRRAVRGRRRHRVVSIRVPVHGSDARACGVEDPLARTPQYDDLPRDARRDGALPGHHSDVRRGRRQLALRTAGSALGTGWHGDRTREPAGTARPAPEPRAAGSVSDAAARAAACRPPRPLRIMFPFVSGVDELREARRAGRLTAAERDLERLRRYSASRADRRDDRDSSGRLHGGSARARGGLSSRSAPTISFSTAWRSIAPTSACRVCTRRCTRRFFA